MSYKETRNLGPFPPFPTDTSYDNECFRDAFQEFNRFKNPPLAWMNLTLRQRSEVLRRAQALKQKANVEVRKEARMAL